MTPAEIKNALYETAAGVIAATANHRVEPDLLTQARKMKEVGAMIEKEILEERGKWGAKWKSEQFAAHGRLGF